MTFDKINNLIDKVIGKEGPLRTSAYWMGKVLKSVMGRIDEKAEEIKSDIDNKLKGKIDRAIPLTYKEFRNMCYKKAGIKGQYYHISDYKPTLSELQEEFDINSSYEGKLYVKYNGVKIISQFKDYCDTVFKGYVSTGEKTYEVDYILHDGFESLSCKWMMGLFESFDTVVVSSDRNYGDEINNLTLKNKASIEGNNQHWLFEDTLTQEEYEAWEYNFENNVLTFRLQKVGDSIGHFVKVIDYTFRTYGSILRMKDCTQNLEVCYDFIGMSWTRGGVKDLVNSKITGYYSGLLPRVRKGTYEVNGVEIINSDKILIEGDYQMNSNKLRIVDCVDVYCSACDNVVLDGCRNVSISKVRDCYFLWCGGIESAAQLYSSVFLGITAKKIEYVYDSYLYYVKDDSIQNIVGIGFNDVVGSHVAIKDGQVYSFYHNRSYFGATPVYPKTTTTAVTDESSGKTMDVIIQELQDRITALEGA